MGTSNTAIYGMFLLRHGNWFHLFRCISSWTQQAISYSREDLDVRARSELFQHQISGLEEHFSCKESHCRYSCSSSRPSSLLRVCRRHTYGRYSSGSAGRSSCGSRSPRSRSHHRSGSLVPLSRWSSVSSTVASYCFTADLYPQWE